MKELKKRFLDNWIQNDGTKPTHFKEVFWMKKATILSGIDRLQLADEQLRGRRVGLMTNPTGMNRELKSTIDIVNER